MRKKSHKRMPVEFPPHRTEPIAEPVQYENEYEVMGINARHHSGVQLDNITEVIATTPSADTEAQTTL